MRIDQSITFAGVLDDDKHMFVAAYEPRFFIEKGDAEKIVAHLSEVFNLTKPYEGEALAAQRVAMPEVPGELIRYFNEHPAD